VTSIVYKLYVGTQASLEALGVSSLLVYFNNIKTKIQLNLLLIKLLDVTWYSTATEILIKKKKTKF